MAVRTYRPQLVIGGGALASISKSIEGDRDVELVDVTTLADEHSAVQKGIRSTMVTVNGLMPKSDNESHWLWAYESALEEVPSGTGANTDKFGAAAQKWLLYLPLGYGQATTAKAGNPVGALQIEGSSFSTGQEFGQVVTWAAAFAGTDEGYLRGEHVADLTSATNLVTGTHWERSFTPSMQAAFDTGRTQMWAIAYLDGGITPLTGVPAFGGFDLELYSTKPSSPGQDITGGNKDGSDASNIASAKICVGGDRLSVIKWPFPTRDGAAVAFEMTKQAISSTKVDIAKIPTGATLRLFAVWGKG